MNLDKNCVVIDVRERDEFSREHIQNSINLPLSEFGSSARNTLFNLQGKKVIIMCRSGRRAEMALQMAQGLDGIDCEFEVYSGGILKWRQEGKETSGQAKNTLPIIRQVLLIAGLLIVTFFSLGHFIDPKFYMGTLFIGMGLSFAGYTGICPMATLLKKMPWNSNRPNLCKV
jgi:rhodanese-related sulfurtransferase